MEFISVSNYVLVYNETIPSFIVILAFFLYWLLCGVVAEYHKKVAAFFLFIFLCALSLLYSDNGPDKGSYAVFYETLQSYSDVFHYLNTVDSPVYYFFMVFLKKIGLSVSGFFIIQNLTLTIALVFIALKIKHGIHLSYYLLFSHLLVPFSVRGHLIILSVFLVSWGGKRIIPSLLLFFIHPLMAMFPLTVLNSDLILRWKKSFILFSVTLGFVAFGFLFSKFYEYTVNSDVYAARSAFSLGVVFSIMQMVVFYPHLKGRVNIFERYTLWLPLLSSFLTIFFPMFGRFAFSFDLIYIILLIKYKIQFKFISIFIIVGIAFLRFVKNYLAQSYYIL